MICVCGKPALRKRKTCGETSCLHRARAHPPAPDSRRKFRLHESDVWSADRWCSDTQRQRWQAKT